ncbi:MAG: hypothetical protein CBARDCOR_3850 [uncultured Caballeronia sp.]|nr:MAG: hypothetical protein CBARDCOR_3850 [uncultured Caballeronia sp.]
MTTTKLKEQRPHSHREGEDVDRAVEDTFPASDPPSTGGVTRIESDEEKRRVSPKRNDSDSVNEERKRLKAALTEGFRLSLFQQGVGMLFELFLAPLYFDQARWPDMVDGEMLTSSQAVTVGIAFNEFVLPLDLLHIGRDHAFIHTLKPSSNASARPLRAGRLSKPPRPSPCSKCEFTSVVSTLINALGFCSSRVSSCEASRFFPSASTVSSSMSSLRASITRRVTSA